MFLCDQKAALFGGLPFITEIDYKLEKRGQVVVATCPFFCENHLAMELKIRKFIHIDMDAFFASVEQRDHPEYRGKPVIVGGDPFGRGVVSTASYEARKFGVHSAMASAQARKLCPQGIFLRPNFRKYSEASEIIMSILRKYTDLVEPVSLDEAYLDVTQNKLGIPEAKLLASMIKQNIFAATKLTASAGVAPNMFLAKIASDFKKPDGLTVIKPSDVQAFLQDLPVRKIPGVGPVTEEQLLKMKIRTCGDLAKCNLAVLTNVFGKWGTGLYQRALGIDHREVEPAGESKQYSSEETFIKDVKDIEWLKAKLKELAREVFAGLYENNRMGKTITLKVKYHDFQQITRSRTFNHYPSDWREVFEVACDLLEGKTEAGKKPIRLLGLGLSGLENLDQLFLSTQPELFKI